MNAKFATKKTNMKRLIPSFFVSILLAGCTLPTLPPDMDIACDNPFPVPDTIVYQAQEAYGSCNLPSLTIAFSFDNETLETDWGFTLEDSYYSTGESGLVFIEAIEVGNYLLDNRQGGWFDHVCGPQAETLTITEGSNFAYIQLWCE